MNKPEVHKKRKIIWQQPLQEIFVKLNLLSKKKLYDCRKPIFSDQPRLASRKIKWFYFGRLQHATGQINHDIPLN